MSIIEKIVEQQGENSTVVQVLQQFFPVIGQAEAALQSQDREDAERYRWIRSKENECNVEIPTKDAAGYLLPGYGDDLDSAIDHARRIEDKP